MNGLSYNQLATLAGARLGTYDIPCPLCSRVHNPRRRVLRVWLQPDFATFHCVRCGESGWARDEKGSTIPAEQLEEVRRELEACDLAYRAARLALALWLWRRSTLLAGTVGERYVRDARGYSGLLPATLRFLPPRRWHHPALIAAFGLANEPQLGLLSIDEASITGVHLTRLASDGSDKIRDGEPKRMIGRSAGSPIVLAPPNDALGLAITEGIENGLSIHEATGLGIWAAGCAGRLPALARALPSHIDCVTVVADPDPTGQTNARNLVAALSARGFQAALVTPGGPTMAGAA